MSSPQGECPEFFKVFLPERSLDKLLIPTAFREHFNGSVPHKAILRDSVERVWQVELRKIEKDVYFQKGWPKFVTDNFLEMGDFLVFRYDGGHIFDFKLYDNAGCEKKGSEEIHVDICKRGFCVKEEGVEEEKSNEEEEEEEEDSTVEGNSTEEEGDSTEDESSDEEEEWGKMSEEEEEEPQPKSSKKKGASYKRKYSGRCQSPIGRKNYRYKQIAIKKSRVASKESSCTKRKYKEASTVQVEENDAFDIESIVQPQNPYFKTKVRPERRSKLYVPLDVLRDHNMKLPPKVTIRDPLGRLWTGKVAVWKDGRTWIGWKAFCMWNNVSENDTCICEFERESGHQGYLLIIHILRAQPSRRAPKCKCQAESEEMAELSEANLHLPIVFIP